MNSRAKHSNPARKLGRIVPFVCAILVFGANASASELIHGRCFLMTNGVVYLDGPCPIILDNDGGFQIGYEPGSDETGYWAVLHAPEGDTAEGNWNAAWGMTHAQASLGLLRRSGACWENSISQMCAWRE